MASRLAGPSPGDADPLANQAPAASLWPTGRLMLAGGIVYGKYPFQTTMRNCDEQDTGIQL